jgi:hypothetical protein
MNEDDQRLSLTLGLRQLRAIDEAMDVVESHLERLLTVDEEFDEDEGNCRNGRPGARFSRCRRPDCRAMRSGSAARR